jgi:hypothetical protein
MVSQRKCGLCRKSGHNRSTCKHVPTDTVQIMKDYVDNELIKMNTDWNTRMNSIETCELNKRMDQIQINLQSLSDSIDHESGLRLQQFDHINKDIDLLHDQIRISKRKYNTLKNKVHVNFITLNNKIYRMEIQFRTTRSGSVFGERINEIVEV